MTLCDWSDSILAGMGRSTSNRSQKIVEEVQELNEWYLVQSSKNERNAILKIIKERINGVRDRTSMVGEDECENETGPKHF